MIEKQSLTQTIQWFRGFEQIICISNKKRQGSHTIAKKQFGKEVSAPVS